MYQIKDSEVKRDFRRILEKEFLGDKRYSLDFWADNWHRQYQKLTKNDNNLKATFLIAIDKYRSVPKAIQKFKIAEKTGDYSNILQ